MTERETKTVIYARCSLSDKGQNPEVQVDELRRYCQSRGWQVAEILVDHGFTGSNDSRPGYQRLMTLARSKKIDTIVVVKLDRLFRSLKHLVATLDEFSDLGIQFIALRDCIDYSTPAGRFFTQILGSLAEFERALLVERTKAGMAFAKRSGKKVGAMQKYDYSEIYKLRGNGMSYRQIAKVLGVGMGTIARALRSNECSTGEP